MRKYIIAWLLASFVLTTWSQPYADKARLALQTTKEDSSKVWLLVTLGAVYQWTDPDSAVFYSFQAIELAQKINYRAGEISACFIASEALSGIGNYPKALEVSLRARDLSEQAGDSNKILWSTAHTGGVYYYSNDFAKALGYFSQLKPVASHNKTNQLLFSGFLGETYFHLNQLDSARHYLQISYALDQKNSSHWAVPYFYLGNIDSLSGAYQEALSYYRQGIALSVNKLDFINGYLGMAGIFRKMNRSDSSIRYSRKALEIAQSGSFASQIVQACEILSGEYKSNHAPDSAFKYMQIMTEAKDNLNRQEKQNLSYNEQLYHQDLTNQKEKLQTRTKMYALLAAMAIFLLIAFLLYRNNRHRLKAYQLLQKQKLEIDTQKAKVELTLAELKSAQGQLIQSEKMASLGELTAGIAHEIQNPLNFVNNFSEVNMELLAEMDEDILKGNYEEVKTVARYLRANEEKITHHGKRAEAIVKGMLQHSRTSARVKEPTDINALADEYLRLAFQGLRAKDKEFNAALHTDFDSAIGKINIIPQDIGRVLLNLYNNAFYAVNEKKKTAAAGYLPKIEVGTKKTVNGITITVMDNGTGIPAKLIDKIFQPFFTSKPAGQGTGLGLSLSYDIIKAHGGEIKADTREGEFTQVIIVLPI